MFRLWKTYIYPNYFFHGPKSKQFFFKATVTSCTIAGVGIYAGSECPHTISKDKEQNESINLAKYFALTGAAIRFLRSIAIGLTISLDYWITNLQLNPNRPDYPQKISILHTRNAERILQGCLINGGTYIKIGQGLVSLSHILPKEYITTLTYLQDSCLARDKDELNEIFHEEFGTGPHMIFQSFESDPIAAASLAQVFVATTKEGDKVAVKVQYKDLQERFSSDVSTIDFLLKLAKYIHPTFDFDWILRDIKASLKDELDFHKEGISGGFPNRRSRRAPRASPF